MYLRKFFDWFFPRVIDKKFSSINGEIQVIEQFGKRKIVVGGLTQSGGLVEEIWKKGLSAISNKLSTINNCLILGLGGGTVAKLISNFKFQSAGWRTNFKITGIEIDPLMIDLGKKYLGLGEIKNLEIVVDDAFDWVNSQQSTVNSQQFDLVLVDLYLGQRVPKEVESEEFLKNVKRILAKNGIVIFNRLVAKNRKNEPAVFLDKLKKIFDDVKVVTPICNKVFICR